MYKRLRSSGRCLTRRPVRTLLALIVALIVIFCPPHAAAQTTAQISGSVTDASGGLVAGAQLKVTNVDTSAERSAQSGDDGSFLFPSLAIGSYKLEVTKAGFETYVQTGIVLQVNTSPAVNVVLQVGNVSQTVEVQANAAMVETQSNGVGQVIQPEQVVDLPLNGRQATQLIALSGAAVNTGGAGGLAGSLDYPNAVSFSVAGSQGNATNYFLDGSSNMDYRSNVGEPMPFPDALQEFKVESSALPADLGSHPGGAVSGITKAGTNTFHGDLFEFLRNGVMDAASYNFPNSSGVVAAKPTYDNLKRNQFGGVIGGPIKRDKLFFFYGFQGTTERQTNAPTQRVVPTAAMLGGDFTALLPGNTKGCTNTVTLKNTVPNPNGGAAQQLTTAAGSNILTPGWLATPSHQIDIGVAALYPTPTDACGDVTTTSYQHDNEFQHVIRTDWQRTPSDTIFARYFITDYLLLSSVSSPTNILSSNGVGLDDRVQNISLGDTHILTPQMISSFRVNFLRTATQRTGNPDIPNLCTLGMTNASCPTPHILQSLFLSPGNQGWDYENAFGISENLGWQIHSHQLAIGFMGEHIQMNGNGTFQLNPLPGFVNGGSSYSGSNLADFVAGMPDTFGQGNGQLSRDGQNLPSLYFQDNWKMTRRFQLNYGVRWDPFFPSHNKYGQAADFNLAAYNAGDVSKIFANAPPGVTFPGDAGFNGKSDSLSHALQFSPRIGIVWDPRGKGLETVRAGYGIFYDTSLMWNAMHVVLNAPWGNTVSFTPLPPVAGSASASSGGGEANPYYGQLGGNIFPTPFYPPSNWTFGANGGYVFQNQQIKPSNAQSWNLSFQKQISANWLVSASYLGSKTTHIWLGDSANPDVVITSGMTAPGILANNVVAGNPISGSCTLLYGGTNTTNNAFTFNPCNQAANGGTANVKNAVTGVTVNDGSARRALNLSNPSKGYIMSGGVLMAQSFGNAAYNGLLASVQHRLSKGFSVNANYTWSHCLDDGEVGQDISDNFQNPANPKADWGNCGFDRRQVFNLSLVAQTPKFSSTWMRRILGNWTASGIFTDTTGSYNNVSDGSDVSLVGQRGVPGSGGFTDRPNQVGDPFMSGAIGSCTDNAPVRTILNWFNTCAFAKQATATFGSAARDSLVGPGHWNFDTAVWRTFAVTERLKMDFRFEGFNVFNHPQFGNPAVSLSSPGTFGKISSGNPMRILQAAIKVNF
jgi:carboxypeptidase family protein